jgi:predicted Zn-dependent peptidase
MPNRNIAPKVNEIKKINYRIPTKHVLNNGIKLYSLYSENAPVVKIDLVFNAGIEFQTEKLVAVFTNSLIKEAPKGMLPNDVSEIFDFYGSFVENFVGSHTAGLRLFVPINYINDVLPMFADLVKNPLLPEDEFKIMQNKQFQAISNNLTKTKYVAMRGLNSELFGAKNANGYMVNPEDVHTVSIEKIIKFATEYYRAANCFIMMSGMFDEKVIDRKSNV